MLGATLSFLAYQPYRSDWEHDHCEFCGAKFSCSDGDLKSGYCTLDKYHWICPQCFEDFKEEYEWRLVRGTEQLADGEFFIH